MKITKFVHSCLLVEDQNQTILIDPGAFSKEALSKVKIPKLDLLLITHEHQDHFDIDQVKQLVSQFPQLRIVSNESVVAQLKDAGITAYTQVPADVAMEVVQHENLWPGEKPPLNGIFTIFDKLTHPGDKLDFKKSAEVLALPIQAPWGSFVWAMETAMATKPTKVIPIHDWHLNPDARNWYYHLAEETLKPLDIEFIKIEDGKAVEV